MSVEAAVALRLEIARLVCDTHSGEDLDLEVMWQTFNFFENSVIHGSDATREQYGPKVKQPVAFKVVE
jgi:hypothetical protein